ncbi:MAG: elongation factor Ts [Amylibacter sp.]|nr:elongation factor Ts [Amylibacter sp.]
MAITAALVKELREKCAAGMMDAKKALTANDGDMEASMDWLRTKGLASAAKKSGRTAAEGLVAVKVENGVGVAVEVNSETDFVGKNAEFQAMVGGIAATAMNVDDIDALKAADMGGKTVETVVTDAIAKIGENMSVRRMAKVSGDVVGTYVHTAAADGMGKIGVLVALKGGDITLAQNICMHVAAANPIALNEAEIDDAILAKEKIIFVGQAQEAGKSEAGVESWSNKQVAKFVKESSLETQKFVMDTSKTVAQVAKDAGAEILAFVRLEVGEGIEKKNEDFAAEVAKTMGG